MIGVEQSISIPVWAAAIPVCALALFIGGAAMLDLLHDCIAPRIRRFRHARQDHRRWQNVVIPLSNDDSWLRQIDDLLATEKAQRKSAR